MPDDKIQVSPTTPMPATAPGRPAPAAIPGLFHKEPAKPGPVEPKDNLREVVETIVFVIVLVLLLKSFVAEAFVIPTGSMAETLWGYQKLVACPKCGFNFPVNCSTEVEEKPRIEVGECTCPNCRYRIAFNNERTKPVCRTGDRVLVAKFMYDSHLPGTELKPFDVVVFKFPEEPEVNFVAMNYIKRLIGLPRQTIGVFYGNIYVASEEDLAKQRNFDNEPSAEEVDLPLRRQMHRDQWKQLLEAGDPCFRILRKPPDKILAERRMVYDNEFQAKESSPRWGAANGEEIWKPNDVKRPTVFHYEAGPANAEVSMLRYRHILGDSKKPALITDFLGYNSARRELDENWVGDLMLEAEVKIEKTDKRAELRFELSKSADRFQARFDLESGMCTLVRIGADKKEIELASKATRMNKPGTYQLRFANFDERLTVWVDQDLPFEDGVAYDPPREKDQIIRGPRAENDLEEPASIGAKGGALTVSKLRLWRDTYYTYQPSPRENERTRMGNPPIGGFRSSDIWGDPSQWEGKLDKLPALTLYVQPGHYLCMGDNSYQSADSRSWGKRTRSDDQLGGLVPESLFLGRALMVYWPISRAGPIK